MPASVVTVIASFTSGFEIVLQRRLDRHESGQSGDDRAEPILRCRVHRGQQRSGHGGLTSFDERRGHARPRGHDDGRDAEHEGALDRPDADLSRHVDRERLRCGVQRERRRGAVPLRNVDREHDVRGCHDDEREEGEPRRHAREHVFGLWLVEMPCAVAFARCCGAAPPPFEIRHPEDENERAADRSQQGRRHRRRPEEGRRDDVLNLRTAGHGVHGECDTSRAQWSRE